VVLVLRTLGFIWGIGGVLLLLSTAVVRLSPYVLEMGISSLDTVHWLALVVSVVFMAYTEGYRGFYLQFSPRVIKRAASVGSSTNILHILLAPLFCMGFIHATRNRKIAAYALTSMIICFVIILRYVPQPWRGIIDAGVIVGLILGILSLLYFVFVALRGIDRISVSPEFPADSSLLNS
jgi:hypothetical protein